MITYIFFMIQDYNRDRSQNPFQNPSTDDYLQHSKHQRLTVPKKYCKKHKSSQFQDNQIVMICKSQSCGQTRFCCLQCIDQFHRKHQLISLKKFNNLLQQQLYHNVRLKEKKQIFLIIEKSHQKFTQKFSQIKIQVDKLLYEISEEIEKVYQNIYASFCLTDYQSIFYQIYFGADGNYNSQAVSQYIQKMRNMHNYRFLDAQSTQKALGCTLSVIEKKFQQAKGVISTQVSKIKASLDAMKVTSLSRLNFDQVKKSAELFLSDSKIIIQKNPGANIGGYNIGLLNQPLDPVNNKVSFRVTKQGQMRQCVIGVCIYDIVKNFNFQNIQGLNRGSYAIDQRNFSGNSAYSWNSHNSSYNNTASVGFNFQEGETITVQVDYQTSQVIFRKGQSEFKMPIKLTLGTIYPFASPCAYKDCIQIVFD